jgi:hypothetical protein
MDTTLEAALGDRMNQAASSRYTRPLRQLDPVVIRYEPQPAEHGPYIAVIHLDVQSYDEQQINLACEGLAEAFIKHSPHGRVVHVEPAFVRNHAHKRYILAIMLTGTVPFDEPMRLWLNHWVKPTYERTIEVLSLTYSQADGEPVTKVTMESMDANAFDGLASSDDDVTVTVKKLPEGSSEPTMAAATFTMNANPLHIATAWTVIIQCTQCYLHPAGVVQIPIN